MSAVSRWIQFPISAVTAYSNGGISNYGGKERGYAESGSALEANSINTAGANRLKMSLDSGSSYELVLLSGTYDPRIIAKNIEFAAHAASSGTSWQYLQAEYTNNKFRIYSGTFGSTSTITLEAATEDDARATLGLDTPVTTSGSSWGAQNYYLNASAGTVTVSGVYTGQFDDVYTVIISNQEAIGVDDLTTPTEAGLVDVTGTYAGTATVGGNWNEVDAVGTVKTGTGDDTYTIIIDTSAGLTMGAGTGNVPTMTSTSTEGDDTSTPVELLYPDYWYNIGANGLRIKFSDAPFANNDTFVIKCKAGIYADGASNQKAVRGAAKFIYSSLKGDCSVINSAAPHLAGTVTSAGGNVIGTKGLYVLFEGAKNLEVGDEFNIICRGPQPTDYNTATTNLSFGNVTVSTNSAVKVVWMELTSGAVQFTTCKFGLFSHGTFQHHDAGNNDTEFRFGTVGAGQPKVGTPNIEWQTNVSASNLINGDYMYSYDTDLAVVDNADDSETVGRYNSDIISDFIFLCLKIGSAETGSNSGISYRCYLDYS